MNFQTFKRYFLSQVLFRPQHGDNNDNDDNDDNNDDYEVLNTVRRINLIKMNRLKWDKVLIK